MLSPRKGLLGNLNHIHLQHISLGLHLSRRPELQEGPVPLAPGEPTGCSACWDKSQGLPEQVDANSNTTSAPCRCCTTHPRPSPPPGLPVHFPSLPGEEEAASPSEPSSSSVSSCSDLSLDDTPVSVYCKPVPRGEAPSPGRCPSKDAPSPTGKGQPSAGRDANLNLQGQEPPDPWAQGSPDSLGSGSLLGSLSDDAASPGGDGPGTVVEPLPARVSAQLDANCNALPALSSQPAGLPAPAPGQPSSRGGPPPVPPRAKRGLQAQSRCQVPVPAGEPRGEAARKTITSFHELAQKRKRNPSGLPPLQAKDQSDWLIVFSPDTELPPCAELSAGGPVLLGPPLQPDPPTKPPGCSRREVTTFKELRYRSATSKQRGRLAGELGERAASQGWPEPQEAAGGHLLARRESPQAPGLPPVPEGLPGDSEEGGRPLEGYVLRRQEPGSGGEERVLGWMLRAPEGERWASGEARREEPACLEVRQSQSFAGAPGTGPHWMANADRASERLWEQKKALLVALSAAVEKIIAHFSTARSLVRKAQLGDSRLSPEVSSLLQRGLCPALYALVADGLKPFQKDVITGQRRSSPWSVVEASVKRGPGAPPLHALYWQVSRLAPLRSTRQRFQAFVLGLLNIKQLEPWLAHLQSSPGVVSVLYLPTAFFSLSQGAFPHLARELLLLVQPLSELTFHLDLLGEPPQLPVALRPLPPRPDSPPARPGDRLEGAAGPEHELPCHGPGGAVRGGSEESAAATRPPSSPPAGGSLKQSVRQVLRWGEQLSQALLGAERPPEPELGPRPVPQDAGDRRGGWWGQLSQASQVYTTARKERVPFARGTTWRGAAGASSGLAAPPHGSSQASANEPGGAGVGPTPCSKAQAEEQLLQAGATGRTGPREPEPPEPSASKSCLPVSQEPGLGGSPGASPLPPSWLGRLFGAPCLPARGLPAGPNAGAAKSRRPSSWLSPPANVLALGLRGTPEKPEPQELQEKKASGSPQQPRAVRALCDHAGAGDHLSFRKGDVLQLLATVDEDWIRCCRGPSTGLVPVGYTSLI
ncbi:AP-4 complex accessory subunit RUSC1 isoform X2 [Pelodiscus sinensis]|uniref:AP-4 complex accessory subunit RUSC1 isoform X2 n=1 Tax=Pelodiscus sinensis TaxID=13735 RepID=UPI003F6AA993